MPYSFRRAPAMHAVKKEATEPPINARNITKDTSDFLSGQSEPIGQVLLICHKNKWHDLWRKLITCLFLFFEGGPGQGNTFIGPTYFFKHVQTGSNLFKLDQTCSNWIKLVHNGSNWFKLDPNWSNLLKLDQSCSSWIKLV